MASCSMIGQTGNDSPREQAVLTIAGSDPSGGAGIQADLKTFATIGVYGAAAITCLTAQNTCGVSSFVAVDPVFFCEQVEAVLSDLPVTHLKIGMVGTAAIAVQLGKILEKFQGEIICDPVMMAKGGHALLASEAMAAFRSEVISRATIITPNLPELMILTAERESPGDDLLDRAGELLTHFPKLRGVVAKGGHADEEGETISDYLLLRAGAGEPEVHRIRHPRIQTRNTHGTGCTFAAAFAAYHLLTADYGNAFRSAVALVHFLVSHSASFVFGRGHGPLLHHLAHACPPSLPE